MIGEKSITMQFIIPNKENPKRPVEVIVQANKNGGICDMHPKIGDALNFVRGQQLSDPNVQTHVSDLLYAEING